MLKNYIKMAWRNLFKNGFYTVLNLIGLIAGISFVSMITVYIWQEYTVNSELKNADRQYMIYSEYREAGQGIGIATLGNLAKALKEEYPHLVANYYRFDGITCITAANDRVFQEGVALGDSTILTMYGFELVDGDARTALDQPFSVVLTEETAIKYFGSTQAVGETLSIQSFSGEKHDFAVTGVMKRTARNSVLSLLPGMDNTLFIPGSNAAYFGRDLDNWYNPYIASFVTLQNGVEPAQLAEPMKQLLKSHADEQLAANLTPVLKPLRTYYLDDNNGAVRKTMRTLLLVAAFLLLMVVINFVNITVSKSMSRLKEIGVRKIMGSTRLQLSIQLLVECLVIVFVSAVLALATYPLLAPVFSKILGQPLPSLNTFPIVFYGYYLVGTIVLALLAGLYPALRLSANKALTAVKGLLTETAEKHILRKSLLGIQFVIAVVVLIGTFVIHRQLSLLFGKDLGFDTDFLITAQVPRDWSAKGLQQMQTIRQEISALPQVEQVSLSYDIPGDNGSMQRQVFRYGKDKTQAKTVSLILSDAHYAEAFKIKLLAGSFFGEVKETATDPTKIVISKKAAEELGFERIEAAVGQQLSVNEGNVALTIAGVTDDFYFNGMHGPPTAAMWTNIAASKQYRYLNIRIRPSSISASMTALEKKWKELMPDAPFAYTFMDEQMQHIYASEVRLQRASATATVLSIIIVVVGVVGLVSLTVQQRVKEIGIRKVLGASLSHIISLFARDFIWVYAVALLLAVPIVYYLLYQWMLGFYLKVVLDIWTFSVPILALALLILSFIVYQTMRAARTKPVDSLRDE